MKLAGLAGALMFLLYLVAFAVGVWAVVEIVQWLTSK